MSEQALDLHSYVTQENERRKRRRLALAEIYFKTIVATLAYMHTGRRPRELHCFSNDEHRHILRLGVCSCVATGIRWDEHRHISKRILYFLGGLEKVCSEVKHVKT
jgi:hypothetical protein